jgi:hypothetical protein
VTVHTMLLADALKIPGVYTRLNTLFYLGFPTAESENGDKLTKNEMNKEFKNLMATWNDGYIDLIMLAPYAIGNDIAKRIQGFNITRLISTYHNNVPTVVNQCCLAITEKHMRIYRGLLPIIIYWRAFLAYEYKLPIPEYALFDFASCSGYGHLIGSLFYPHYHCLQEISDTLMQELYPKKQKRDDGYYYIDDSLAHFEIKRNTDIPANVEPWLTDRVKLALERFVNDVAKKRQSMLGGIYGNKQNHTFFVEKIKKRYIQHTDPHSCIPYTVLAKL